MKEKLKEEELRRVNPYEKEFRRRGGVVKERRQPTTHLKKDKKEGSFSFKLPSFKPGKSLKPSTFKWILMTSVGFNLVICTVVLTQYVQWKDILKNGDFVSHQEVLKGWKPFADKDLGESDVTEGIETSQSPETEDSKQSATELRTEEDTTPIIEDNDSMPSTELNATISTDENSVENSSEMANESVTEESTIGFSIHSISEELQSSLNEIVTPNPTVITYDDLRLVKVLYWGFDNQTHMGELIVNKAVATDIKEIFEEVYAVRYPIEKIRLISEYENSDEASMEDNNTSSFNYREITNGSDYSLHAYGLAIDINPKMNPYVTEDYVLPQNAMAYVDRDQTIPGMIQKGDALYKAFTSRGWTWGGDWTTLKDYQHFSKDLINK